MIGIVFFTADLRMESGLWAAGTGFILLGGKSVGREAEEGLRHEGEKRDA